MLLNKTFLLLFISQWMEHQGRLKVDANALEVVRFCRSEGGMHSPRCGLRLCFGRFLKVEV